ncbi:MAG TPA: YdeI/OmpD-associated family protein [Kineosporiaceae bacterium]|nr:YdeI/OmpD-associated family protein [Kineosporiaceae bacterium]
MKPLYFASAAEFGAWLAEHHDTETEVYVGYWKKATGRPTLTWSEAVDEALRFGWIDGVRGGKVDDERHVQRFTPRKARSTWSLVNVRKAEALIAAGRMEPAGLAAFQMRRADNTGIYSFERAEPAALEPAEEAQFRANAAAWEWFEKVAPSYRKAVLHWVVSAKQPQTRARRLATLIEDSAAGLRIKPMRR